MKFEKVARPQHPRARMEQSFFVLVEVDGEMVRVGTIQPQTRALKVPNLWVSYASVATPPGSAGWMKGTKPIISWLAPIETPDEDIARWLAAGWGLHDDPPPGSPGFASLAQKSLFDTNR